MNIYFQVFGFSELVEKSLSPEERVKKIEEKKGFMNQIDIEIREKDDVNILKMLMNKKKAPFEPEETTYEDAQKRYGLILNHFPVVS